MRRVQHSLATVRSARAICCNGDPSWPGKRVLLTNAAHMFRVYRTFLKADLAEANSGYVEKRANLDSLNHTVRPTGENSFEVFVGGSLEGKSTLLNALFAVTCHGLHLTAVICIAVFDSVRLQKHGSRWSSLEKRINEAARGA